MDKMIWISPAQVCHNEVILSEAACPDHRGNPAQLGHWGGDFSLQNLLRCVFPVEMTKLQAVKGGCLINRDFRKKCVKCTGTYPRVFANTRFYKGQND